jgi:hypothetical protein
LDLGTTSETKHPSAGFKEMTKTLLFNNPLIAQNTGENILAL